MIVVVRGGSGIEYYRITETLRTRSAVKDGAIVNDRTWIAGASYTKVSKADVDAARASGELVLPMAEASGFVGEAGGAVV